MKFASLPPAGNPISLKQLDYNEADFFPGLSKRWVSSGTAALAEALCEIRQGRSEIDKPEVLVPAYCCPDLISATLYAGCQPVLVDTRADSPKFSFVDLTSKITSNTVAVIAINFLGLPEDVKNLKTVCLEHQLALIEDNAQWFPETLNEFGFEGDYATFSFGRGKALSLLGGGLVLSRREAWPERSLANASLPQSYKVKNWVYQVVTNPWVYRWVESLPFLNIGATEYHALESLGVIPDGRINILVSNHEALRKRERTVESIYRAELTSNQMNNCVQASENRLLRFPYLCRTASNRDKIVELANREGLGVSKMYQQSLSQIESIPNINDKGRAFQNAQHFAERFLTLPTHQSVKAKHAHRLCQIIQDVESL